MKTTLLIANSNGFMYVEGRLVDYKFISAILDFENGLVEYTCKLAGEHKVFTADSCPTIYADEQSYKATRANDPFAITLKRCIQESYSTYIESLNSDGSCHLYVVEDNGVVSVPAPLSGYRYIRGERITTTGDRKYFGTYDEASLYCEVVKVDENGVETTVPSTASRLALNEEQLRAVENVRLAIQDAELLGVSLVYDLSWAELMAYSETEVKRISYEDGEDIYSKYGERINTLMHKVGITLCSLDMECCGVYADLKK